MLTRYPKIKGYIKSITKERTVKYSFIILPSLFTMLINVVIGKLISVYILPENFGLYSLQFVVFNLLNAILIVPLINAYKTYSTPSSKENIFAYFDQILYYSFIISTIFLLMLIIFAGNIFSVLSVIFIGLTLLVQGLLSIRLAFLNLSSNYKALAKYTFFSAFVNFLVFILLVVIFNIRSSIVIWSVTSIYTLITLVVVYFNLNLRSKTVSLSKDFKSEMNKKILVFCFPLIIVAFFNTINNYADRYFIQYLMSTSDVGIYSVGYGLGSKIAILMTPILIYLTPVIYNNIITNPRIVFRTINRVLLFHFALGITCCIGLYFMSDFIGHFFLSDLYKDSFEIIPLIAFAFIIFNSIFAIETHFYASGNTKLILYHNIVGAIINLALNFLLIPIYGIKGAAFSSILSYSAQFLFAYAFLLNAEKKIIA